ncbi:MAG: hypothetical protein Q9163_005497 [Psora crenata]
MGRNRGKSSLSATSTYITRLTQPILCPVLSFMTAFGAPRSPQSTSFSGPQTASQQDIANSASPQHVAAPARDSPPPRTRTERASSRPMSMIQTYQPPLMEIAQDTIPELQPIFTFLNSHANKLYQEGYFLKLNDLDSHGRPNADRSWTESFAQLVGTIISLWDASALDAAGQDGEVAPTFINLADASIKMIETLPTRSADVQPLQNVLSISTAGKNRYLLHFNSLHSLTQWTAAIRLAMYENATLQEAYTGSLIAGKGKLLNNIRVIMDRTRIKNEDWTRVRFGAGTPWRRCWCVITPPDEKEFQKQQKQLKKKSVYERATPLKGKVQFFDTKKTKKAIPVATINDAYSAYAIYPQSKPLIDQSTLIKVEGSITIHSTPDITTEGFVFVMPEVHPGVTGFEMMLRYLFPLYDVFALYGRPTRLIADTLDTRSLMFALPQERRYGYLEILDVAGLIHESGSQTWNEREWRKRLRDLTSARMSRMTANGRTRSRASSYREYRNSLPGGRNLRYEDGASIKSTPSLRNETPPLPLLPGTDAESPYGAHTQPTAFTSTRPKPQHQRSVSEAFPGSAARRQRSHRERQDQSYTPSRLSHEQSRSSYEQGGSPPPPPPPPPPPKTSDQPPPPPAHGVPISLAAQKVQMQQRHTALPDAANDRSSSESERRSGGHLDAEAQDINHDMRPAPPPSQVAPPPAFSHEPGAKPQKRPGISPDVRRANSRLSITTLQQLSDAGKNSKAGGGMSTAAAAAAWKSNNGSQNSVRTSEDQGQGGVIDAASKMGNPADRSTSAEGMAPITNGYSTHNNIASSDTPSSSTQEDAQSTPYYNDTPLLTSYDLLTPQNSVARRVLSLPGSTGTSRDQSRPENDLRNSSGNVSSHGPPFIGDPPISIQKPPPMPIDPLRPQPARLSTNRNITRKPVPNRTPPASDSRTPPQPKSSIRQAPSPVSQLTTARSSMDSLQDRYIDEDALAQVLGVDEIGSITNETRNSLQDDDASVYDNESTVSPDYASTRQSTETKRSRPSVERPRRGVLKTVGTVEADEPEEVQVGDARYRHGATPEPQVTAAIPVVDFGPTRIYNPATSSRPATSGTLTHGTYERSRSSDRLTPTPSPLDESRAENPRSSVVYFSERQSDPYERSPSRNLITPEPQMRGPSPTDDDKRRSVAWQPGAQIGGGSPGTRQSITPEQFVQQRAAASRITPIYAHGRHNSASPTPPNASRQSSGEWPIQLPKQSPNKLQKRHSSYGNEIPARPHSRAASNLMNVSGDYTNHLSAREQEHVARVTGSPLINMAGNTNKHTSGPGSGLVGAIEAREKEKREIKEGFSGHMVQQAIAQRQYHSQQHRPSSRGTPTQQYAPPAPQYAMPGGFPPSPGQYASYPTTQQQYGWGNLQQPYVQQQQQQRQWTPPSAGQLVGPQQHLPYQQQPQQFYAGGTQHGQYQEGQQQLYGSYFGNGQARK